MPRSTRRSRSRCLFLTVCLTAGLLCLAARAEDPAPRKLLVYVGAYTQPGKSEGVYRMELDLATGKLTAPILAGKAVNPSFLALHPDGKHLYTVGEISDFGGKGKAPAGAINAFAIGPDGDLTLLNQASSRGAGPCHLIVDHTGKYVLAANYGGGNACVVPLAADGKLGEATGFVQHKGKKAARAHSINLDPANRFAFVADAGLDRVFIYHFAGGKLTANVPAFVELPEGAAPRHFAFHPNGKFAYVINEADLSITVFRYAAGKGSLVPVQTISTVPEGWKKGSTAEVVVHPSGKFVYGSNRGHDSIAVFAVAEATGKLTHVQNQGKGVKTPRNFAVDPTGKYCLVANQDGGCVIVFRIDSQTGKLEPTGEKVQISSPVCVRFLRKKG